MPSRHYKTYKKRPTAYQAKQKRKLTSLSLVFASLFTLSAYSALSDTLTANRLQQALSALLPSHATTTKTSITPLTILPAKNDGERETWLASFQACEKHGLNETIEQLNDCAGTLHAIAATETGNSFNLLSVGDSGKSQGAFQIHQGYHPNITTAQAQDPYFSADWTLARMINNDYKTNSNRAIMKHNGTPNTSKTLAYLNKVNSYKLLLNN